MKIRIEFSTANAAFEDDPHEINRIIKTAIPKVHSQRIRKSGCVCTTFEADDRLFDLNGNTCGTVEVTDEED